jgi:hypothetical protein
VRDEAGIGFADVELAAVVRDNDVGLVEQLS